MIVKILRHCGGIVCITPDVPNHTGFADWQIEVLIVSGIGSDAGNP